ncbi:S-layer homology domain-containing protein [Alkaliphilus oremlandii]|uniref:S-layer domain protein n=1 Tax=Alkaliphilus oremlandii (strain OhILAs) TaxID=350688 RepID=A8MK26_ALKOO|nr:S-layer homology domain-containing protein [Alkaliphilus oremlandii]ABW20158.1 S-layer domain protein [Alkaliphilus oremlandii OhILAs]
MKKVLSFILVLSMVLSSFGMAFAAPAKNEIAGHLNEDATLRLADLGIVKGDDRGFALDANITRAEFAVLLVRALGLEGSANVAKGETQFTDVTVAAGYEWASGAINVATRLGYIQGYGNGKFGPADNIRYEDAITLMVRALGYEPAAQAKGGYPVGYLVVAEQDVKNTKHVEGATGVAITRGSVFQLLDNSLTKAKMIQVGYGSETKYVVSGKDDTRKETILTTNLGFDEVEGTVVANYRVEKLKANEIKINVEKENGNKIDKTVKYTISDKFDFDVDAVLGLKVSAWYNDDNEEIFRYEVETAESDVVYGTVVSNKEDKKTLKVEVRNKDNSATKYEWAEKDSRNGIDAAVVYIGNEKEDVEDVKDGLYGKFVLNEYGDVAFAYLIKFDADKVGMAKEVKKDELKFVSVEAVGEDTIELDDYKAADVFVFNADFSKASLEDIKEGTAIFGWENDDDQLFFVIRNDVVEGKLEAVRARDNRVTVNGTNIVRDANDAIFSGNEGTDFEEWASTNFEKVEEFIDEKVVVVLNLQGRAMVLTTDADYTSKTIYGVATYLEDGRNPVLTVFTSEGKEVEYKFEDRKDVTSALKVDYLKDEFVAVEFKLNKDGEISKGDLKVVSNVKTLSAEKKSDDKFITIGKDRFYIRENTVAIKAINSKGELKPSLIKHSDIAKRTIKSGERVIVVGDAGRNADLIVFVDKAFEAKDDAKFGLVTGDVTRKGGDYKVEIDVAGEAKAEYIVAGRNDVKKGDLVEFKLNNKGELTDITRNNAKDKEAFKVTKKDGDYLLLDGKWYLVSNETVVYKVDEDGALDGTTRLSRISDKDSVVFVEDAGELKVLVVVTEYKDGKPGENPGEQPSEELTGKLEETMYGVVLTVELKAGDTVSKVSLNGSSVDANDFAVEDAVLRVFGVKAGDTVKVTVNGTEASVKIK